MKTPIPLAKTHSQILLAGAVMAAALCSLNVHAWPLGRTTFHTDAPFSGTNNVHSLAATSMQSLFTVSAWADAEATIPANLYQWWWIFGADSGLGNGALLDGTEAMTLEFNPSVGAAMIYFLYTGGTGGTVSNLARLSIGGFANDPGASAVMAGSPRISNISYTNGIVTFDYLNDGGGDYGQLLLADPKASAGKTLTITGGISPDGDATGWGAALYRVDVQEAFGGPYVSPTAIPHNTDPSYSTPDGALTIKAYSDRNATISGKLGRYLDECFGVYGQNGGNVVDTNEAVTLQLAGGMGLSRLDSVYSSGEFSIAGFAADPGFVDSSSSGSSAFYADGVLTVTLGNSGFVSFYFNNRAASAGQTLRITVSETEGSQLGIAGMGYATVRSLIGPDLAGNFPESYPTPDGLLTLTAYADTPGTAPSFLNENVNWFGIAGGNNNEAIEGTESLTLQFNAAVGLDSIGTRYTSGKVIISGFTSDPGFNDPSGTATGVSYSEGTLNYTFDAPTSPERVVHFNPAASQGQTLSIHTEGSNGSQIALTRIHYASGQTSLSIARFGNDVAVSWSGGALVQSTSINGNYTEVSGAVSPHTNSVVDGPKYFRVKTQ
jgi:hypothetical protein